MSTTHPAAALADGFSRQLIGPEQPGYDEGHGGLQRDDRPPSRPDRPLREHR
jgi:hypothetical protein